MKSDQIATHAWVWRTMVKTGLIPLILVESVLIAVYLLSNHFISSENMSYIYRQANSELLISARRETSIIREKLITVANLTKIYQSETQRVLLDNSQSFYPDDQNLDIADNGVLYSKVDDGGAASFYSSYYQDKDMQKVLKLGELDPLIKQMTTNNELVSAVYFNTWDSYNRIYPWFFTLDQYPPDMNIPEYNFYYLADAEHNPGRGTVWTDVYIDPAGQGWMASSIAPVYNQDFLEGVVGLDITVGSIVENIQNLSVPWGGYAILTSNSGNIMALPPLGEIDFGVTELTDYSYQQAITKEIFKPDQFNLFKREDTQQLSDQLRNNKDGITTVVLNGENKLAAWSTIPETNWQLILIVDENQMYAESRMLEDKYQNIGYILILGLVGFYSIFLVFIWFSSKRMSSFIGEPLLEIQRMLADISLGNFKVSHNKIVLKEIDETANYIVSMGGKLDTLTSDLRNAKIEAENANIAKSQFISNISHEIRTPMNAILGMSHILMNDNLSNEQKNYLSKINKAGTHLSALIDNVLDLSKIDSGKIEIENISFDVKSILNDVYDITENKVASSGLGLKIDIDNSIPRLFGDPLRIKQVLLNYVSNAVKFTAKGDVILMVELLNRSDNQAQIKFSVQDNGIGLTLAEQEKIFDSFQQADASTTRKYGGTGLGLTISKHIGELMGGSVGVESEPGKGSTFWLILDLMVDHSAVSSIDEIEIRSVSGYQEDVDLTQVDIALTDIMEAELKLDRLSQLLSDHDLESQFYFAEERDILAKVVPVLTTQLAKLIDAYEFTEALTLVNQIREALRAKREQG